MRSCGELSPTRLVDSNSAILSLSADGSVNWPRTIRLAEFAHRDGITHAVVTVLPCCLEVLRRRSPQFSALLHQRRIPIEIESAIELTLQNDLFQQAEHLSATLNGPAARFVYLRVPADSMLPIAPVVQRLREMNLTAILLAPERCRHFRENRAKLAEIVSCGGKIQLSAASLLDQTDRQRIRFCRKLIRRGLCHFVASESGRHHDLPISLREAHEQIVRWASKRVADALCCGNPGSLFQGERVQRPVRAA